MSDGGLALLTAWLMFAALLGVLVFVVLHGGPRQ
jgi:hypothetical protein